jgi:hypothetical protein
MVMKLSLAIEILDSVYKEYGDIEFTGDIDEEIELILEITEKFNSLTGKKTKEALMTVKLS